jgi:hypothetical protein
MHPQTDYPQSERFEWCWRRPTLGLWLGLCGCFKAKLERCPGRIQWVNNAQRWRLTVTVLSDGNWREIAPPREFKSNMVARQVADLVVDAWLNGGYYVEDEKGTMAAEGPDFELAWALAQEVSDVKK